MNFNRIDYKERAKVAIKDNYWLLFAVTALFALSRILSEDINIPKIKAGSSLHINSFGSFSAVLLAAIISAGLISLIIKTCISVFVTNPIECGVKKIFTEHTRINSKISVSDIFFCFKNGRYLNVVLVMFVYKLIIWAGTLFCIIPGIIFGYMLRFVPYIIAENPEMHIGDVLKKSNEMTNGIKAELFIMDLSFLGWTLLGALACGVGVFFVNPYIEQSFAFAYEHAKNGSLE